MTGTAPEATVGPVPSGEEAAVVSGIFDVGGHSLYLECVGTGAPAVIYMHGWIDRPGMDPHRNGLGIARELQDDYRVCMYDRRNVGHSDSTDEVQDGTHVVTDLHNLLAAAEIEPPYVLLGASFGGVLSYLYANTYPDEVVGIVLLDAAFPDEATLEHLLDAEDRQEAFVAEDAHSLERIVQFDVYEQAAQFIGSEPSIPLTYLASLQEPWTANDHGSPEYDDAILEAQTAYVERFSPGDLIWVDAPHFMEPVIPEQIADAVRGVIARGGD